MPSLSTVQRCSIRQKEVRAVGMDIWRLTSVSRYPSMGFLFYCRSLSLVPSLELICFAQNGSLVCILSFLSWNHLFRMIYYQSTLMRNYCDSSFALNRVTATTFLAAFVFYLISSLQLVVRLLSLLILRTPSKPWKLRAIWVFESLGSSEQILKRIVTCILFSWSASTESL